jgi:hypothetical protein
MSMVASIATNERAGMKIQRLSWRGAFGAKGLGAAGSTPAVREEGEAICKDFDDELGEVEPKEDPVHCVACCRPPLRLQSTPSQLES